MGREFFLDKAIARGFGSIRVDDNVWRVAGEDMPTGTRVRVVAIEDGSAIRVERHEPLSLAANSGSMKCENS